MSETRGSRLPRGRQPARDSRARTLLCGDRQAEHLGRPVLGRLHRRRHHRHSLRGDRARLFGQATVWANETTVYLSAVTYLLGGGYALLKRGHVRIDLIYGMLAGRPKMVSDLISFVCFAVYVGALIWVGTEMAWTSFLQSEGTGTPWNPPIWPVKMAIPIAGLLLLLQGIANLVRELGILPEVEQTP